MTKFTVEDYKELVKKVYNGDIKVSNESDSNKHPETKANVKVDYQSQIK